MQFGNERQVAYLGMIALGAAVLFVTFPANMLAGNADEIPAAGRYFLIFAALGLVTLALGWLLVHLASQRMAGIIAALFAGYAVSIYVADLAFPLGIGPMEDGNEVAPFQALGSAVQLVLLVVLAGVLLKVPSHLTGRFSWVAAAVLVASAGIQMASAVWSQGSSAQAQAEIPEEIRQERAYDGFNIYQVVFDAYQGPWLQFAMRELGMQEEVLARFTYYPAARSNYWYTQDSFPSFLSGTLYRPDMTRREWRAEADASSLISDLNNYGYETTIYGSKRRPGFASAQRFFEWPRGVSLPLLLDYWTLRAVPVALRPRVLSDGRGAFSRIGALLHQVPTGDTRSYDSYRQFQEFLFDEAKRPASWQYVLLHAHPPHGPDQLDRHGNYIRYGSYEESLLLATRMMEDIISRLKELGRYEQSLIIFHSDHGIAGAAASLKVKGPKDLKTIDDATSEAIARVDVRGKAGRDVDARYSPLLAVKAPVDCADSSPAMKVDSRLVQLLDLRAYLRDALSDPGSACGYPLADQVDMYHGLSQDKTDRINHYRITSDFEWHIMDDIPLRRD